MKTALLILTAACMQALPILEIDGIPVPMDDSRIGAYVYAVPGTNWNVWGNDNAPPTYGDHDFNDAVMQVQFNMAGIGTATWVGANSAWHNHFMVEGHTVALGSGVVWTPTIGEQVAITLVTQYGATYEIGSKNVLTDQHTPEPGTLVLIGAGLIGIGWRKWRRV